MTLPSSQTRLGSTATPHTNGDIDIDMLKGRAPTGI